jgi:hypothetical protein
MAVSFNDMDVLRGSTAFQARIRAALISYALVVGQEAVTVSFHKERANYAAQVLNAPDGFVDALASAVATATLVINDATQNGTVALTTGNVATQQALVTDAHITTVITAGYNSFFRVS